MDPDHLFKQLPTGERTVEHLSSCKFGLENGDLVTEPSRSILRGKGMGQMGKPPADHSFNLCFIKIVKDLLQRAGSVQVNTPLSSAL